MGSLFDVKVSLTIHQQGVWKTMMIDGYNGVPLPAFTHLKFEIFGQLMDFLLKKMEGLPDSHVLSTCFMRSDWLKMKYPDVGMKCKQSHVVKCSIDHQKIA